MDRYATQREELIESTIARALDSLFGDMPAKTITRQRAEHALRIAAQHIATDSVNMTLLSLLTTDDMAATLNVTPRRVRALAKARGVGWQVSRGTWIFRPNDVERLRPYGVGRPRKVAR